MRNALLPIAAWAGVLQAVGTQPGTTESIGRLIGIASVLGTLTVLVYRLGVWRQEMEQTKHDVERRLEAIDHMIAASADHRARISRWQSRTERRLDRFEAAQAKELE